MAALYDYSTEFTGVGDPPADYQGDDLGHCSQICIFRCHGDEKAVSATASSAREIYDLVCIVLLLKFAKLVTSVDKVE